VQKLKVPDVSPFTEIIQKMLLSSVHYFLTLLLIFLAALNSEATQDACRDSLQRIGDAMGSDLNDVSVAAFLNAICSGANLVFTNKDCYLSLLGLSSAYAERRRQDKYPQDLGDGCTVSNPACEQNVARIVEAATNASSADDGDCVCHFFSILCDAKIPTDGSCEKDILRVIQDYDAHKVPLITRAKRDFWSGNCRSGKRLPPVVDGDKKLAWRKGYDTWKSWVKQEEDEQGFVYRSVS